MWFDTMFLLYRIAITAFQLLYWIGLLFPLDYSLFNMIIVTLRFWRWYVPFQKLIILHDFFDLRVYSLRLKLIKYKALDLNGNRNCSRPAQNEMLFPLNFVRSGTEWKTIRYNGNRVWNRLDKNAFIWKLFYWCTH